MKICWFHQMFQTLNLLEQPLEKLLVAKAISVLLGIAVATGKTCLAILIVTPGKHAREGPTFRYHRGISSGSTCEGMIGKGKQTSEEWVG